MDTTVLIQVKVTIPNTEKTSEQMLEAQKAWITADIVAGLKGLDCDTIRVSAVEAKVVPYTAEYVPSTGS
jgi:hypothetical protein